jgi:hypothetical protein
LWLDYWLCDWKVLPRNVFDKNRRISICPQGNHFTKNQVWLAHPIMHLSRGNRTTCKTQWHEWDTDKTTPPWHSTGHYLGWNNLNDIDNRSNPVGDERGWLHIPIVSNVARFPWCHALL